MKKIQQETKSHPCRVTSCCFLGTACVDRFMHTLLHQKQNKLLLFHVFFICESVPRHTFRTWNRFLERDHRRSYRPARRPHRQSVCAYPNRSLLLAWFLLPPC